MKYLFILSIVITSAFCGKIQGLVDLAESVREDAKIAVTVNSEDEDKFFKKVMTKRFNILVKEMDYQVVDSSPEYTFNFHYGSGTNYAIFQKNYTLGSTVRKANMIQPKHHWIICEIANESGEVIQRIKIGYNSYKSDRANDFRSSIPLFMVMFSKIVNKGGETTWNASKGGSLYRKLTEL